MIYEDHFYEEQNKLNKEKELFDKNKIFVPANIEANYCSVLFKVKNIYFENNQL